jgi:hypothetical protein
MTTDQATARLQVLSPEGCVEIPLTPTPLATRADVDDERTWGWVIGQSFYRFWLDEDWEELRDAFLRDEPYTCDLSDRVEPASWPGQPTLWRVALVIDGNTYYAEHSGPQRRVRVAVRLPIAEPMPGLTVCSRVGQTPVSVAGLCIKARRA